MVDATQVALVKAFILKCGGIKMAAHLTKKTPAAMESYVSGERGVPDDVREIVQAHLAP
jgi:hypothetical protein